MTTELKKIPYLSLQKTFFIPHTIIIIILIFLVSFIVIKKNNPSENLFIEYSYNETNPNDGINIPDEEQKSFINMTEKEIIDQYTKISSQLKIFRTPITINKNSLGKKDLFNNNY